MIKVYEVTDYGNDGRDTSTVGYFIDPDDAKAAVPKNGQRDWGSVSEIEVWEKGEYSIENVQRKRALEKLTNKEKKLLGLT